MSQSSGLKKDAGNGNLSRASLDDSYAIGEGLKRSALSSSLRDLSEAGRSSRKTAAEPGETLSRMLILVPVGGLETRARFLHRFHCLHQGWAPS